MKKELANQTKKLLKVPKFFAILYLFFFALQVVWIASQRRASDSITYSSALSNSANAHNVSCLGLFGRFFWPEKLCLIWAQLSVSM